MSGLQNKDYSMADFKVGYNDINVLCDYAEELLATIESTPPTLQQTQLELIEPIVNEIADASDVLSEEFLLIAESKKNRVSGKFSKKRIEVALRKIYAILNGFHAEAKEASIVVGNHIIATTNQVIKKIQQQLDKIVTMFFEMAQISLQSIMSKSELDSLKSRNSQLALMMNQYSLGQYS